MSWWNRLLGKQQQPSEVDPPKGEQSPEEVTPVEEPPEQMANESLPTSDPISTYADVFVPLGLEEVTEHVWRNEPDNRRFTDFSEIGEIDSLEESGQWKEALALALDGMQKYPDSYLYYDRAGRILKEKGDEAEAVGVFERALKFAKVKTYACDGLAEIAFAFGEVETAVAWWLRCCRVQLLSEVLSYPKCILRIGYICGALHSPELSSFFLDRAHECGYGTLSMNASGMREQQNIADDLDELDLREQFLEACEKVRLDWAEPEKEASDPRAQGWAVLEREWEKLMTTDRARIPRPPVGDEEYWSVNVEWEVEGENGEVYQMLLHTTTMVAPPLPDGRPGLKVELYLSSEGLEGKGQMGLDLHLEKSDLLPVRDE